jgi:hypothetical protein
MSRKELLIQAIDQIIADKPKEAMSLLAQEILLQPNYAAAYVARTV